MSGLATHLESGATTVARAWALTRRDGVAYGFTDHDVDLNFENIVFRAGSGLTARALAQSSGLSVDNTEAAGALSHDVLNEADIRAGRFDGAALRIWQVNWSDVAERRLIFRGTLGEITREDGAFRAELRGLSEALGQPMGRVYQPACDAVLGDAACGVDLTAPGYSAELRAEAVTDARVFRFTGLDGFADRWFERGRIVALSGTAEGLVGVVKNDRRDADGRTLELWQALGAGVAAGDELRLEAGCDKRPGTCRLKFGNLVNFRGFPHVPGEDWLMAAPRSDAVNDGGSRST